MGAIGGSIVHAYKGFRNSPRVNINLTLKGERISGSLVAMKVKGPIYGGLCFFTPRSVCSLGRAIFDI